MKRIVFIFPRNPDAKPLEPYTAPVIAISVDGKHVRDLPFDCVKPGTCEAEWYMDITDVVALSTGKEMVLSYPSVKSTLTKKPIPIVGFAEVFLSFSKVEEDFIRRREAEFNR